jgi:hypothetical protein
MESKQATSINEVITILDEIILESEKNKDPSGYFAALYRKVTLKVKEGIKTGYFEDGETMEKLDVIFANRYINAYYINQRKGINTLSWEKAFDLSAKYWPIVLQHLLIGMNAHISLDLGIAAAEISKGKNIEDLKGDFNKINEVLSSLVAKVENDLSKIWPTLKYILKLTKNIDGFLIAFSMEIARDKAWKFATSLALKSEEEINVLIKIRDKRVANNARIITNPGIIANFLFVIIRIGERGTVASRIQELTN